MNNRVTVYIAGQEYNLIAPEDPSYVHKVASHVDQKVTEVSSPNGSLVNSAILAAVNIADEYFKEAAAGESLRHQLKECLEEAAKLKLQLSEAKREIFKLEQRK